jgi:hypothetical protein
MTRRNLAAVAAVAAAAPAQPPAAPAKEDLNANAKAQIRNTAAALDKFPLPMAQEPAFQFKA